MTAHDARISRQTVRRHWEQAHRVNIAGQTVTVEPESPHADALWMKESLARVKMALPKGFCTLPLQKSCAHANACLTWPLFVTTAEVLPDHHRPRQLIRKADEAGHSRLAESNRTVERNPLRIISALDEPERCCGGVGPGNSRACASQPEG